MSSYFEPAAMSCFSFLRGASHPEELVRQAHALGLGGIALTDRNSLAGVVRAHLAAKEIGIAFRVGVRLVFADAMPDVLAWPCDRAAYGRLSRLLTRANLRGAKGHPVLLRDDLMEDGGDGLLLAVLPQADLGAAEAALPRLAGRFPNRVWLALRAARGRDDARRAAWSRDIARRVGVPLLAVGDVLHHHPDRRPLQDVLTCIREGTTLHEAGRLLEANAERHLKPPAEISRLFKDLPEAVAETRRLFAMARFSLDELRYEYPDPPGGGGDPQADLVRLTEEGAARRFPSGVPARVRALLEHEYDVVGKLGYARYFLTVHDIVRFARTRGILAQGRGSAANSAVCYCLGITEVDPDRADLLFERFISPERGEPPDIDVDFEHERREEVVQYIYETYGRDRAGIAAAVSCFRARSAVREVGKAFGLSADVVAALSGTIWGGSCEIDDGPVREAGLDPARPPLADVLRLARELIGLPRHLSQHVGGFVVTKGRLDEVVPIAPAAMDGRTVIEWDKDDLDALGILKIDVLALGMLSCLRRSLSLLADRPAAPSTLADIPPEDPAVYEMLGRGDSLGVFQVESRAQMAMLPRLKPKCFYDLVIEVAIVRPGPIQGEMVHPYLRRKEGLEPVSYPSPAPGRGDPDELKKVLGKTLGVPLFQEQAMRIAIVAAGFAPAEADKLRRAMSAYRRAGTIQAFHDKMVDGMVARGYERRFAEHCFRQIEGFGQYGFPESHAASFALLVYASAWMKCRHPDVFAAALLNSQPMGFYAPAQIARDAREHGVEVRPVDVNRSDWDARLEPVMADGGRPAHLRALRLGLRQVKGLRRDHAERLVSARARGYDSVRDLHVRSGLPISAVQRLADADAFRSIGLDRRTAAWAAGALDPAGGDLPPLLAGAGAVREPDAHLPPMPIGEHVINDFRSLGLSLKAHPVALLRPVLGRYRPCAEAGTRRGGSIEIAGLVLVRQRPGTANGIVFVTIEDESGVANLIIRPAAFERFRSAVVGAQLLGVEGRVQKKHEVAHVLVDRLTDLSHALARLEAGACP